MDPYCFNKNSFRGMIPNGDYPDWRVLAATGAVVLGGIATLVVCLIKKKRK